MILTDLNEFARLVCYGASIKDTDCKSVSSSMYRMGEERWGKSVERRMGLKWKRRERLRIGSWLRHFGAVRKTPLAY